MNHEGRQRRPRFNPSLDNISDSDSPNDDDEQRADISFGPTHENPSNFDIPYG